MLKLFTDSDTDITPEVAAEYGYSIISMPYSIDGKNTYPYEDFDKFDSHAFYDKLRTGVIPTTSALGEEKYIEYFEPVFAAGDDILYVHFSRAMSATFANMDKAVDALLKKYPDRKFHTVDTKAITILAYNIVLSVGDLYKSGKTAEEIVEWAKTEVDRYAVYFYADDLKFFRHSGRVGGLAATMGTLLGVRPIIYMNSDGVMMSIGKERGRTKATERLLAYVDELGDNVTEHRIIVGHSDAQALADEIVGCLKEKYGHDLEVETVVVNPTAGSHCGPDSVGITFYAKHR